MLRGVSTVVYLTTDLDVASRCYAEVLGIQPYFDRPARAEFRLGDYQLELGLLDARYLPDLGGYASGGATGPAGVIAYWHVDTVSAALDRLVSLGASTHHPPRDFSEGFVGATAIDLFANIHGIMNNPHYRGVLLSIRGSLEGAHAPHPQTGGQQWIGGGGTRHGGRRPDSVRLGGKQSTRHRLPRRGMGRA
jgi:predicted enzyme related to lactoylglutathione lyase